MNEPPRSVRSKRGSFALHDWGTVSQEEERILKRVKIEKLADLENKIIGVVVVAMAVAFLGKATDAVDALEVLQGGIGVAVAIAALCVCFSSFPQRRKNSVAQESGRFSAWPL